ncbi:hypothetical protein QQS21_006885 [Conoideocrella luteorostrata]|uniref:Uncharacterized protein n=1 Tax=Conoideocrella luteorostrata TaxID=1105319 RepID=A0AAJ0CLS8_9HYPO|nr:hypothetical protein QQS21_006885 [Conoideocrella luteorostrata]
MASANSVTDTPAAVANHDTPLQISPPATSSPSSPPPRPVANRVATPLSLFFDGSCPDHQNNVKAPPPGASDTGMGGVGRRRDDLFATMSPAMTPDVSAVSAVSPAPVHADGVTGAVDLQPCVSQEHEQGQELVQEQLQKKKHFDSNIITTDFNSDYLLHNSNARTIYQPNQTPAAADPRDPVSQMTKPPPPPDHDTEPSSPFCDARPLRTASVRADTRIAHPKPLARPPALNHAVPDKLIRSGSAAGNIAQLEATAERLSMTSSIDDAIRDLHGELKRSDSRRSAKLALTTMAAVDEMTTSVPGHIGRHISAGASIVSTNNAARQGGYSPAGFVMSPSTSLTSRLRSGSANSAAGPDATLDAILSRHGTGKSSVRSVRSSKLSLAEISESEPVSLDQKAFDEADAAPPLEEHSAENLQLAERTVADMPNTDAFHQMLEDHLGPASGSHYAPISIPSAPLEKDQSQHERRPESVHSNNTSEQARDAFIDFDGVHWEPEDEEDLYVPEDLASDLPTPRPLPVTMTRPTSYLDPSTGQKMLYYPARVPAMLNLPPKLSSRPKTAVRNERRSQVLGAMMDASTPGLPPSSAQAKRHSAFTDFGLSPSLEAPVRDSWLPDPVANHRDSFAALSSFGPLSDEVEPKPAHVDGQLLPVDLDPEIKGDAAPETLRRPERLSKTPKDNRKSMASVLNNVPPQLRASAFFDLPSIAPEVEIKDGSAMATLDSILDASANAPVSAFTDHSFAGKLGPEVYGKQKKHRPRTSVSTVQALTSEPQPKKRSSMMWLGKRSSSHENQEQKRPHSSMAITSTGTNGYAPVGDGRFSPNSVDSADRVIRVGAENEAMEVNVEEEAEEEEEDNLDDAYQGPPTTLLAELQLRKQEQKQRVRNLGKGLPNGNYATLLEMDTIAEAQRKNRQNKRVNLAWEDADAHLDQNGSDDEDVPLAIIAAMQRGAKNLADLERPIGLMERREIEDNEPLSHRRARLQGLEPQPPPVLSHRQSMMSSSVARALDVQSQVPDLVTPSPEPQTPEVEEIEEETLVNRRRRLATRDGELPKARPVSSAFSLELLSQFGDAAENKNESKDKKSEKRESTTQNASGEEETLGQRRRRLQAEREARDREISYTSSAENHAQPDQDHRRRLSLANVLSAHPKREVDTRAHDERLRNESERRAAQDRDNKMAALRMQMPTSLPQVNVHRSGAFLGGAYNDGTGGYGSKAAVSSPVVNTYGLSPGNHRSSMMTGYGAPAGQPPYGNMTGYGPRNHMGSYNGMSSMSLYNGRPTSQMYGGGGMMPMQINANKSMDRVEQWRYDVRP